ncbi:hypothetical protein AB204_12450 [Xenorhabdus khoisanae]|uniref:Thoeris anti-defense 2-like domain-containing protein n=1 Tax=Xenorhabdus khoisanae TaxID=880157 RepID=A0A0J5FR96_9GAMM|nr:DUF2829 domain-containing protein [Xenorhabdus khoisanae]KMJ44793.1 hypothetical protein AB204_12450 [Xenorhabdus khoisanae]
MSDVIKPENECPFDPKHYQCDCFIAPVGSFSWALIQLKLRKRVTRSAWKNCQGNNEMYLAITPRVNELTIEKESAYAVDGVAVGTQYDYLTHIDLRNEHGNFVPWQPTQEDMMACDWAFVEEAGEKKEPVKPELETEPKFLLKGKLTIGTALDGNMFGYADLSNFENGYRMGEWEEISNNTSISELIELSMSNANLNPPHALAIFDDVNVVKIRSELGSKRLIVKCLDKEYDLGMSHGAGTNKTLIHTQTEGSLALEELFTSSVGKTLELELAFYDE